MTEVSELEERMTILEAHLIRSQTLVAVNCGITVLLMVAVAVLALGLL